MVSSMISKEIETHCKDIEEWPDSWKYDGPDIATGKKILYSAFVPLSRQVHTRRFLKNI